MNNGPFHWNFFGFLFTLQVDHLGSVGRIGARRIQGLGGLGAKPHFGCFKSI